MQYQSLTIENFRGIKKLKIDDLKRVNLLVGRNNCGKTSVLEAVFLLSGMSNATLPVKIHKFRGFPITKDQEFSFMFKDLNFQNEIVLRGTIDDRKRNLTITPIYADESAQKFEKSEVSLYNYAASTDSGNAVDGIKLDCRNHQNELVYEGKYSLNKNTSVASPKETLNCVYLPSKTEPSITEALENLTVQKKLDTIISVLQKIEPNITDIRIGAKGIIYIDVGGNHLLPINIMGDGMRRILAFLTAIAEKKNGIVLIDEIENGLHYSSLKTAWNAILTACKAYNVQLIATTHSYEAIEALSNAYAEIEPQGDDIRLYRLDKDGENHKAYSASARALEAGIEKNFEAR